MAYNLTNTLRALLSRANVSRATVADATLTNAQTTSLASHDLGASIYTRGAWQFLMKTPTGIAGAGTTIMLAAAVNAAFTTNKRFVAGLVLASVLTAQHFVGLWEASDTIEFLRWEVFNQNAGLNITFDAEVVGIP